MSESDRYARRKKKGTMDARAAVAVWVLQLWIGGGTRGKDLRQRMQHAAELAGSLNLASHAETSFQRS